MKKLLTFTLAVLLLLCCTLGSNSSLSIVKAEGFLPHVAFVGLEHYPLVEGDTNTLYLSCKDYSGKVQYQVFISKDGGDWSALTDYLPETDAKVPFAYKIPSAFAQGSYRMAIRVKIANTEGAFSNQYGYYDDAYPFNVECVTKDFSTQLSTSGNLITDKEDYNLGETIKISGIENLSGMTSPYLYKLNVYDADNNEWINNITNYGDTPAWQPTKAGTYVLDLWTISNSSSSDTTYDGWKLKVVTVKDPNVATLVQFEQPKKGDEIAVMTTNKGVIKIQFFPQYAPKAVENFKTHAKEGYYNGLTFHRVINDFMIQGGDPTGTGRGGESIWKKPFEDEFTPMLHNFRGALSMANSGSNTNGSQFFIVQNSSLNDKMFEQLQTANKSLFPDNVFVKYALNGGTPWLDYHHTVFGQVFDGMDVVDGIAATKVDDNDKPLESIVINKIDIVKYE